LRTGGHATGKKKGTGKDSGCKLAVTGGASWVGFFYFPGKTNLESHESEKGGGWGKTNDVGAAVQWKEKD